MVTHKFLSAAQTRMAGPHWYLRRFFAPDSFLEHCEKLPIVVLKSPSGGGPARGQRTRVATRRFEHLPQAPGQVFVIVRIIDPRSLRSKALITRWPHWRAS